MKQMRNLLTGIFLMLGMLLTTLPVVAQGIEAELDSVAKRDDVTSTEQKENTVDVKEIVFGHIGDAYEWHITTWGKTHVTIPLPIIVYSSQTGWHAFLSSRLEENGGSYEGFFIAPQVAGTKVSWLSMMQPETKYVLGIFLSQSDTGHC